MAIAVVVISVLWQEPAPKNPTTDEGDVGTVMANYAMALGVLVGAVVIAVALDVRSSRRAANGPADV